ncbi:MAG: hypothetical protein AB2392_16120 [Neobacillus sp.]
MTKKWVYVFSGFSVVVVAAFFLHWYYFAEPESFPVNEELVSEINRVYPEAVASAIQDTVFIDNKHVFVPFLTEKNEYGISFWAWKGHEWKVLQLDTAGNSVLWKIDENDSSSYHFVWNIHPDDQISYLKFYFVRDRGFGGYKNIYTYSPKVQLDKKVSLEEKSYGVLKVPKDWLSVMKPLLKMETGNVRTIFSSIFTRESMYFGYTAYNAADEESSVMKSVNGRGYGYKGIETEFVRHLDESQLEVSLQDPKVYIEKTRTYMEHRLLDIERVIQWIDQKDYGAVEKLNSGPMSNLEMTITYMKQAKVPDSFSTAHQKLLSTCEDLYNLIETHGNQEITDDYMEKYKQYYLAMKQAFEEWKLVLQS